MAKKTEAQHDYLIPELKLTQVADIRYDKLPIVRSSDDAVNIISQFIAEKDLLTQLAVNEFAFVLYMNSNNRVIGITNLSVGGIDATLMDVRLVFSMAVKIGAVGIITAHNHPSGNLKPSDADVKMSSLITQGGKTLSIRVLDFMIITTNNGYYSFADESIMAQGGMFAKGGAVKPKINAIVEYEEIKTPETNDGYTMVVTLIGYDRFQKSDYPTAIEKAQTKRMLNEDKDVLDKLGIKYKLDRDVSAPRIIIPKIDDKFSTIKLLTKYVDVFSISNKDKFAKGGITEHGLRVGDTIVEEIDESTIIVENPASGRRTINISTGTVIEPKFDDEGNLIEIEVGDEVVEYRKRFPNAEEKTQIGSSGRVIKIVDNMAKVSFPNDNDYEEWIALRYLKKIGSMAKGGRMGFQALSEKVASNYEGKSVPAKFRSEYGSRYDKEEAKEVGNKVAAKVYRLQQAK